VWRRRLRIGFGCWAEGCGELRLMPLRLSLRLSLYCHARTTQMSSEDMAISTLPLFWVELTHQLTCSLRAFKAVLLPPAGAARAMPAVANVEIILVIILIIERAKFSKVRRKRCFTARGILLTVHEANRTRQSRGRPVTYTEDVSRHLCHHCMPHRTLDKP
jgi:hypothetical protein